MKKQCEFLAFSCAKCKYQPTIYPTLNLRVKNPLHFTTVTIVTIE